MRVAALENDLRRMRIMHATCVDTVALYPHPRGPPFRSKLSALTEKHLARRIQEGTHDSVADARATMELALLKFTNGPGFGEPAGAGGSESPLPTPNLDGLPPTGYEQDVVGLFDRAQNPRARKWTRCPFRCRWVCRGKDEQRWMELLAQLAGGVAMCALCRLTRTLKLQRFVIFAQQRSRRMRRIWESSTLSRMRPK